MNHTELCHAAAKWIRRYRRCSVVLVDVKTINTREQPDVLAWQNGGFSVLVECKVDVHDFIRDKKKSFRKKPEKGMGRERWYAMPKGLWEKVPGEERHRLTDPGEPFGPSGRWGLVEIDDKGKAHVILQPEQYSDCAQYEEKRLLITSVRRVTEGWGRGMFEGVPAEAMANGDRHPRNRIRELESELRHLRNQEERLRRGLTVERDQLRHELECVKRDLERALIPA